PADRPRSSNRQTERPIDSGPSLLEEARALFQDGEPEAALDLLSEENLWQEADLAESLPEEIARGWVLRGMLLVARSEFDKAADAYDEAVNLAPYSSAAWLEYGNF